MSAPLIDLSQKRALITGGSRGVGAATARLLAAAGARVAITYRTRRDEAEAVAAECRELAGGAWAAPCDLARPERINALIDLVNDNFGALDILVANAGVWPPEHVEVGALDDERWRETIEINLTSVFRLVRATVTHMRDNGRIVLVSSTAGQRGEPGHADYAASKGGMISFCKSVAVETAQRGITVNCVAPGWIDTEMVAGALDEANRKRAEREIPLGRIATAEDVAGPIAFLCSDLARHVTGEVLNVNGGSVMPG